MDYIIESQIETGYYYWINQYSLGLKYKLDEINIKTYPYPDYWFGQFFSSLKEVKQALNCLMCFLKYNRQLKRK